jgi:hypothetical protein
MSTLTTDPSPAESAPLVNVDDLSQRIIRAQAELAVRISDAKMLNKALTALIEAEFGKNEKNDEAFLNEIEAGRIRTAEICASKSEIATMQLEYMKATEGDDDNAGKRVYKLKRKRVGGHVVTSIDLTLEDTDAEDTDAEGV